jgi:ribose-phosphate pyrophosphokinase
VLIVDDLIDTGGTFVNAVEALKGQGAKEIYGICTHGILSGSAVEKLNNSSINKLMISNTLPLKQKSPKIEAISVGKIFAQSIRRTNKNESISSLFDTYKG